MTYEILPHTAEIGIAATGDTMVEAISEAICGLAAIMCDASPPLPEGEAPLDVTAEDEAALLAAVLDECLYLVEAHNVLAVGCDAEVDEELHVRGRMLIAPAYPVVSHVKAVTYHEIALEPLERGGWRAQAYFDV